MEENNNKYVYPVEELDKIIDQMSKGITPMMSDQLQLEVKLRYKELQNELFDGDDEDIDTEDIKRHNEMMKQHLEEQRRKATKNDVVIIKLSEEQQKQIREDMEVSIVRPNPNSMYNLSDDELYSSEERKVIQQKLSRIKNCYYNQIDYVNAIKILKEAIEYSLANDYPWLSKEEAIKQFNEGKIKFTYCNIPKLYINYQTQITDKDVLKGIVTGEIELVDRDEKPQKKKVNKDSEEVAYDYNIIGTTDYENMLKMHVKGYDTPISTIIKAKSTIYNRYSLPTNNRFSLNGNNKNDEPMLFDWTQEDAGRKYFNLKHGKQYTVNDMIRDVNLDNDKALNNVLNINASEFMRSLKTVNNQQTGYSPAIISTSLQPNPEAVQIEQNILNAIRMNNPNK